MAKSRFFWPALVALAVDTPAGAFWLSGMSQTLLRSVAEDMEFHWNWQGAGDELTPTETDAIDAAVALMEHEIMTALSKVLVRAYATGTAQTISDPSTAAVLNFTAEDYDSHDAYDGTNRFICPVDGVYLIEAHAAPNPAASSPTTGSIDMVLIVNGTAVRVLDRIRVAVPTGLAQIMNGVETLALNEGDEVQIGITQANYGTLTMTNAEQRQRLAISQLS